MEKMNTIIEEMRRQAKIQGEKLEQNMEERERKRDEETKRKDQNMEERERKRDEQLQQILSAVNNFKDNKNSQNDGVFIKEAQNLQVGGGNRIVVRGKSPRKKPDTPPKGKAQPFKQYMFPANTNFKQPLNRAKIHNRLSQYKY